VYTYIIRAFIECTVTVISVLLNRHSNPNRRAPANSRAATNRKDCPKGSPGEFMYDFRRFRGDTRAVKAGVV